ncbi:hypothetical protein HanOQP8_Chr03g0085671 [Helianthus annuus]|nr:hypothetical protein HanOQP8_Chr03g0085671 [Helianthus annuus]
MYLSNVEKGGETIFPQSENLNSKPTKTHTCAHDVRVCKNGHVGMSIHQGGNYVLLLGMSVVPISYRNGTEICQNWVQVPKYSVWSATGPVFDKIRYFTGTVPNQY